MTMKISLRSDSQSQYPNYVGLDTSC